MTLTAPTRPTAVRRLQSLYASPGPYVSIYVACGDISAGEPINIFANHRAELEESGATPQALDAIEARLHLPVPDDAGGWALHAASDGSTAVDFAHEGPVAPILTVASLPVSGPLLEWDQWRIAHATVSCAPDSNELVSWVPGTESSLTPLPADPLAAASTLRDRAITEKLRLLALVDAGGDAAALAQRLRGIVPPHTNVVELDPAATTSVSDTADATVRYVADVVARDTVSSLEDFRFLLASGGAVEGTAVSLQALRSGRAQKLLIHDDPTDPTAASFGSYPWEVSDRFGEYRNNARRADVAVWAAVSQGVEVRVIPSTGPNGPTENIAVVLADDGQADLQ